MQFTIAFACSRGRWDFSRYFFRTSLCWKNEQCFSILDIELTSKSFFVVVLFSLCLPITDYFVYIYTHTQRSQLQRSQEIILAISQKMASNNNFYYCREGYKIDFCLVSIPTLNSGSLLSGTIILLLVYPLTTPPIS